MRRVFVLMFFALLGCKEETAAPGSIHQFSECYEKLNTGAISERNIKEQCARESEVDLASARPSASILPFKKSWLMEISPNSKLPADFIVTSVVANLSFYDKFGNEMIFSGSTNTWIEPSEYGHLEDISLRLSVVDNLFCHFGIETPDGYTDCNVFSDRIASEMPNFPWCTGDLRSNCRTWRLISLKGIPLDE